MRVFLCCTDMDMPQRHHATTYRHTTNFKKHIENKNSVSYVFDTTQLHIWSVHVTEVFLTCHYNRNYSLKVYRKPIWLSACIGSVRCTRLGSKYYLRTYCMPDRLVLYKVILWPLASWHISILCSPCTLFAYDAVILAMHNLVYVQWDHCTVWYQHSRCIDLVCFIWKVK